MPAVLSDWLQDLLSAALLLDQLDSARTWVEATGCLLIDLLDDDAFSDLNGHLGLRKYEAKRLWKALKQLAQDSVGKDKALCDYALESPVGGDDELLDDAEPEPERSFSALSFIGQEAHDQGQSELRHDLQVNTIFSTMEFVVLVRKTSDDVLGLAVDFTDATRLQVVEVKEGLICRWNADNPSLQIVEGDFIVDVNGASGDSRKLLEMIKTDGDLEMRILRDDGPSIESSIASMPSTPAYDDHTADHDAGLGQASPVEISRRLLLDQLERLRQAASETHALEAIATSFENADELFAAFESFGPAAVAMFKFDDTSGKFGLTSDAQNIFRELGIEHMQKKGLCDVKRFFRTIRQQELHRFGGGEPQNESDNWSRRSSDCSETSLQDAAPLQQIDVAPATRLEVRVLLVDGCERAMVLQKRAIGTSSIKIVLELREQCIDSTLVLQLDVAQISEIHEMRTSNSTGDSLSFVLASHGDVVIYSSTDQLLHHLHKYRHMQGSSCDADGLALHVVIGTSRDEQSIATHFFNGLRMLAKLPMDSRCLTAGSLASLETYEERCRAKEVRAAVDDRSVARAEVANSVQNSRQKHVAIQPAGDSIKDKADRTSSTLVVDLSVEYGSLEDSGCSQIFEELDIKFNALHARWPVVVEVAEERGYHVVTDEENAGSCNIHWYDESHSLHELSRMQPWMRVNHFPGTCRVLGRKCRLARSMARMRMLFPAWYSFVPRSWILPEEFSSLEARVMKGKEAQSIFIVKPDGLSQGRGIFLTDDLDRIRMCADQCRKGGDGFVVQKYIAKPMLLDGLKFDIRLYLLVCGSRCGPDLDLRLFMFQDGLVRLCTTKYEAPTRETFDLVNMHLTNYEVNRNSKFFKKPMEDSDHSTANKRPLTWLLEHLASEYGREESQRVWADMVSLCVKTVLAAQPTFEAEYDACFSKDLSGGRMGCRSFEILGFDVMLTSQRKARLIEVNHLPSLGCDSPLDHDIKHRLIHQTLDITCGPVESHSVNKHVYEGVQSQTDPGSQPSNDLLDSPYYKDFIRVFPPSSHCPGADELSRISSKILEKVRGVFGSIMSNGGMGRSFSGRSGNPSPLSSSVLQRRASGNSQGSMLASTATSPRTPARRNTARKPSLSHSASAPSLANGSARSEIGSDVSRAIAAKGGLQRNSQAKALLPRSASTRNLDDDEDENRGNHGSHCRDDITSASSVNTPALSRRASTRRETVWCQASGRRIRAGAEQTEKEAPVSSKVSGRRSIG